MDAQSAPPPNMTSGSVRPVMGNPPVLGQQVPGHTGGLPALGGLSVSQNPMAQKLQSYGRGQDTMLVHMTPGEVNSLQGLAMAHGGSLTVNPHTGLPEAGFLSKLLPMLAGFGLNFLLPGGGIVASLGGKAATAGLITGLGTTAITGDLKSGLMAGLGAFGGASLGGGVQGALGGATKAGTTAATTAAPTASIAAPAGLTPATAATTVGGEALKNAGMNTVGAGLGSNVGSAAIQQAASQAAQQAAVQGAAKTGLGGFMQGFGNTAKGLPVSGATAPATGLMSKIGVPLATMGLMGGMPSHPTDQQTGAVDNSYEGPYYSEPRTATFAPSTQDLLDSSKERTYFNVSNPGVYNAAGQLVQPGSDTPAGTPIRTAVLNPNPKRGQPMYTYVDKNWMGGPTQQIAAGYAGGGAVRMDEGSFVMPARETAEFGKGSTNAGQRILAGLGGIPIRGHGDGISDSIPASIGKQKARVADGEVHFPREAVERIGGGDHKRGTEKLYAMMHKATQSRKRAARGGAGLNLTRLGA